MANRPAPRPVYTQSVSVGIRIAGEQPVSVDTHGGGHEPGSFIAVHGDHALVYVYDAHAARSYADGWIDAVLRVGMDLPETIACTGQGQYSPVVVIRAYGHDQVRHFTAPARTDGTPAAVGIQIGTVTWLVQDRAAYHAHAAAWQQVADLAPMVLARGRGRTR